ncbi:MAG TPA: ribosome maturation factor RimM [Stellaceae bacterium]|nr:ribosome maturation factor RimM [Stellaceae bacterium]
MPERRVCLGVITGAHGVKGMVRVKSFTADPQAIASYGPLEDEAGQRRFTLELTGAVKGVLLARLAGITDRDAADSLKGTRLYLARAALPAPGDEEYYHTDLIGLAVLLSDGSTLGRVRAIHDYGAGDSIEVATAERGVVIVPFTRAAVPVVDLAGGRIIVEPPAGLLEPAKGGDE